METKVCTKCKNEYSATSEFFHAQKAGKYGLKSVCKECAKKRRKERSKLPEVKRHNNLRQHEWRNKNKEKTLSINRKSYNNNAERINYDKRERYKTDKEYKLKIKERELKYVESGRRHEMNAKPENRQKATERNRERRLDPEKKAKDYARNSEWRDKNRELLRSADRKHRDELSPSYIACCMRKKVNDLSPEIIETKRNIILLKREINNNIKIR